MLRLLFSRVGGAFIYLFIVQFYYQQPYLLLRFCFRFAHGKDDRHFGPVYKGQDKVMVYVFIISIKVPVTGFVNKAGNGIAVDVIREAVHVIPMVIFVSNFIERVVRQLQIGWVIRLGKGLYEHLWFSFEQDFCDDPKAFLSFPAPTSLGGGAWQLLQIYHIFRSYQNSCGNAWPCLF